MPTRSLHPMLRVDIAGLEDGLHERTLRPSAEDLALDPGTFSGLEVTVRLDVAGRRILAAWDARAVARLECDRTLEPYDQPIRGGHHRLFVPPEVADGLEDDDVEVVADDQQSVEISEPVRDTLLLALPLRRVAPHAEDVEIPTRFGGPAEGEPADDRWAALQRLRNPN